MKVNAADIITTTGSIATGTWGAYNINDILGIIVLGLSILNILVNLIIKVYDKIVSKNYKDIPNDIDETIDSINNLRGGDNNAHK